MSAPRFPRLFRLSLLLVAGATLAPATSALAAPAPPRAERPTYTLGEKWIRDDGTYELVRIEADRYVFAAQNRWIELSKDLAVVKVRRERDVWECTPVPLTWPLEVGQRGSSLGILREPNRVTRAIGMTWSVETYELVRVSGGTFRAFQIEVVLADGSSQTHTTRFRIWYAPEARQYVKGEEFSGPDLSPHRTFEVVAVGKTRTVQIVLHEPDNQARVTTASYPLNGRVTAERAIMQVVVTLNGREISRHDTQPGTAPREVPLTVTLPLRAGKNALLVTAMDAVGVVCEESRTLLYDPPTPVATTQIPSAPASLPSHQILASRVTANPCTERHTPAVKGDQKMRTPNTKVCI